jgi:prevent-host-death family protein
MAQVTSVGLFEAKTHLSEIIRRVVDGEMFIITVRGEPVAELRPLSAARTPWRRGQARNPRYRMAEDFDEPLAELADYR